MTRALACLLLVGCGRLGFGAGDRVDGRGSSDAPGGIAAAEITPPAFSTTSTTFVPVPGATLTVPPSTGTTWLLLVSATLRSTTILDINVEARYLVDGVERGMGGTQVNLGAGPWQHFYVLAGTEAAQTITFELRDASGGTATLDQLHAVIVPLPANAEPHYASMDAPQPIVGQTVTSVPISLGQLSGSYLVLVLANDTDTPALQDVYVDSVGPAGEVLIPSSQNAREAWQSMFMARLLSISAADAVFTFHSYGGTSQSMSQLRDIRVLALRPDAFSSFEQLGTATLIDTMAPAVSIGAELMPTMGSAATYLYLASSWSGVNCISGTTVSLRRLHFIVDGADRMIEHASDNCAMQITYGAVGLLSARPATLQNGVSSGNGESVYMVDSQIVLLGLP